MKNFKLITDTSKLNTLIDSIKKRGNTLQDDIHRAACSIIAHVVAHGDVMPARRLVDAVPQMTRKNALLAWFEQYGPLRYDTDSKELVYDKTKKDSVDIDSAKLVPFWEYKQEAEYKGMDFVAELAKLVKRAEKARKEYGDSELTKIPTEIFDTVKEITQKAA